MADAWSRQGNGPYRDVEVSLERAMVSLATSPTPNARALSNEAERLRSIVAGWRTHPPRPEELYEVTQRVQMLVTAASSTRYSSRPPPEAATRGWDDGDDTTVYNPDDDPPPPAPRGGYEDPPTNRRHSAKKQTAFFGTPLVQASVSPSTPPPPEAVVIARPIVIEAEPMETTDPARPALKPAAFEAVKDAVLVDDVTAEPLELSRRAEQRPGIVEGDVRVVAAPSQAPFDKRLTLLVDPYSDRADAYRSLARKLAAQGRSRVIAITSAEEKEGKSTCAANLALALREGARGKVLLVEANLRTPSLARMFGFVPPECFDDQLRLHKTEPRRPWTVVEQHPPLHVLAVDASRGHQPMLDPAAFFASIETLKAAGYDHILLDTPPVLGGAAVNVVADHVDGVVIAVTARKTTRRSLKRAVDQLAPATILGVVMIEGA